MSTGSNFPAELARTLLASPEAVALLREALGVDERQVRQPLAYTVPTLAAATGLSEKAIRGAIRRGQLHATRRGGERGPYLIDGDDARAWVGAGRGSDQRPSPSHRRQVARQRRRPMSSALAALEKKS
jgi:hypothetical protein